MTDTKTLHTVKVTFSKFNTARRVTLVGRDFGTRDGLYGPYRTIYMDGPRGAEYGMHIYSNNSWRVYSVKSMSMNDIAGGRDADTEVEVTARPATADEVADCARLGYELNPDTDTDTDADADTTADAATDTDTDTDTGADTDAAIVLTCWADTGMEA